ncbi:hypothetical protein PL373_13425 [Tenacibaculum maritimum]|nr:hypothetical protein [Tenacibaculum maritimum]MDB0602130.1 hypothetical protein [Tenacibaculum maritimum]MDB0613805.1 hypothetical protein [Tenacibaculum maritimum]
MENTEALQVQVLQLEELNPRNLPEFQGWKEKQQKLVTDNPFIKITDNKSYDEAKKRRTALVTGRTTIQKQDQFIGSKIKDFRSKVSDLSKELIAISLPYEEKQQNEVKRFEEIKAKEKAEKERLEQERVEKIKQSISFYYSDWKSKIDNLELNQIDLVKDVFEKFTLETDKYGEYELDFQEKVQLLKGKLTEKINYLNEKEEQRKERERLDAERKKLEEEKKAAEEKARKEREELEAERKRQEELQKKRDEEAKQKRLEEEQKLAKEKAEIQAEKDRLAKIEADRIAKIEADKKAKEDAERQAKLEEEKKAREKAEQLRLEAIKPDKEKISKFIESLQFTLETPDIKDEKLKDWLNQTLIAQRLFKESMELELSKLS